MHWSMSILFILGIVLIVGGTIFGIISLKKEKMNNALFGLFFFILGVISEIVVFLVEGNPLNSFH
jgi:uncharacterized membrane protein HdeD (DUF308 family)